MAWEQVADFPYATAVYRLFDSEDLLLYVGVAGAPYGRLDQHYRSKNWWPHVDYVEIDWFVDRATALDAELYAIRAEAPVHNVQGRGGRHQRRQTPAPSLALVKRERLYWQGAR